MTTTDKELAPLYYGILLHFRNGTKDCTQGVVEALKPRYGNQKLLTPKNVEEALATAKENGLLEEADYRLSEADKLIIYYRMTKFGTDMIERYL